MQRPVEGVTRAGHVKEVAERLKAFFQKATVGRNAVMLPSLLGKIFISRSNHAGLRAWGTTTVWLHAVPLLMNVLCAGMVADLPAAGTATSDDDDDHPRDIYVNVERMCTAAYVSTALMTLAASASLLLLDASLYYVLVVVTLLLLVLGFLAFLFWQQMNLDGNGSAAAGGGERRRSHGCGHIKAAMYFSRHNATLTRLSAMSSDVASFVFAGLSGAIVGYVKASASTRPPAGAGHRMPEELMLYSGALGLATALITAVPPWVVEPRGRGLRDRFVNVHARVLAYAALLFLALACVLAAQEILHGWAVLIAFANLAFAAVCFRVDFLAAAVLQDDDDANGAGVDQEGGGGVTNFFVALYHPSALGMLMAAYSTYAGGKEAAHLSWLFKCFVWLLVGSIVTYLCRMVIKVEMRGTSTLVRRKVELLWTRMSVILALLALAFCVIAVVVPGSRSEIVAVFV